MKKIFAIMIVALGLSVMASAAEPARRGGKSRPRTEKADTAATPDKSDAASVKAIVEGAKAGDPVAMRTLGYWYIKGINVEKNAEKAAKWWAKAAKGGDALSTAYLGFCFQNGTGIEKADSTRAAGLFRKALELGCPELMTELDSVSNVRPYAGLFLADYHHKGKGPGADKKLEPKYLARAAELGNINGIRKLGLYHMSHKQYADAYKAFLPGAKQNDPASLYYTAYLAADPKFGLDGDATTARINMLAAADANFAAAQNMLGNWYDKGMVVTQDPEQAMARWQQAAANGNDRARWTMGIKHINDSKYPTDYTVALNWLTSTDPAVYARTFKSLFTDTCRTLDGTQFANFIQGLKAFENGKYADARTWFKKAEKGKLAQAATYIALCDYTNKDVKFDNKKYISALKKQAKKNDAYAKYLLASIYNSTNQNTGEVVTLLNEAAAAGLGQAYAMLGNLAAEGRLMAQSYATAADYFNKAYLMNGLDNEAAAVYADILENGRGNTNPNPNLAEKVKNLKPDVRHKKFLDAVATSLN